MHRWMGILAAVVMTGCAHGVWYEGMECETGECARADARVAADTARVPDSGTTIEEDTAPQPEDTAPAEDTRTTTGDPCDDCLTASCSTEISACFADASCKALNDCFGTCSDETCASDCYAKYPSPAYDSFVSCAMSKCTASCS